MWYIIYNLHTFILYIHTLAPRIYAVAPRTGGMDTDTASPRMAGYMPIDGVGRYPGLHMCCRDVPTAQYCEGCIQAAALASPRHLPIHLRRQLLP